MRGRTPSCVESSRTVRWVKSSFRLGPIVSWRTSAPDECPKGLAARRDSPGTEQHPKSTAIKLGVVSLWPRKIAAPSAPAARYLPRADGVRHRVRRIGTLAAPPKHRMARGCAGALAPPKSFAVGLRIMLSGALDCPESGRPFRLRAGPSHARESGGVALLQRLCRARAGRGRTTNTPRESPRA